MSAPADTNRPCPKCKYPSTELTKMKINREADEPDGRHLSTTYWLRCSREGCGHEFTWTDESASRG